MAVSGKAGGGTGTRRALVRIAAGRCAGWLAPPALVAACAIAPAGPVAPTTPPIEGRVDFGAGPAAARTVQASPDDIATAATVSLIDPGTTPGSSRTIATTVTRPDRTFSLDIRSFSPLAQTYYVEAVKGLQANLVGHDAVRLRTLVRWDGGWSALTARDASLGPSTTALAAIVALRSTFSPVDPGALMGKLNLAAADPFTEAGTGVAQQEFDAVKGLVIGALADDRDPIAFLTFNGTSYDLKPATGGLPPPFISGVQPRAAAPEALVTIAGGYFQEPAGKNAVSLGGKPVGVVDGSSDWLKVRLPADARSGILAVANSSGIASTPLVVVVPVAGGLLGSGGQAPPAAGTGKDVVGTVRGLAAALGARAIGGGVDGR